MANEMKSWMSAAAGLAMAAGLVSSAAPAQAQWAPGREAEKLLPGRPPETVLDGIIRKQDTAILMDPSKDFSTELKREWMAHKASWNGTIFSNLGYGYVGELKDEAPTAFNDASNPTKGTRRVTLSIALDKTFKNFVDKALTILFVKEGTEWRMSDISYQDGTTFRSRLRGEH